MNRSGLLATVGLILASSPSFAQFGGTGGAGGAMGGQNVAGTTTQGRRSAASAFADISRSAQIEMEGGQLLSGRIDLRSVVVDGDLGQYLISPEKIKMIRFLKPVTDAKPGDEAEANDNGGAGGGRGGPPVPEKAANRPALRRGGRIVGGMGGMGGGMGGLMGGMGGMMGGMGGDGPMIVSDSNSRSGASVLARGKVITTSDKEIIGTIHIPTDFKLDLDFGALTLAPDKLRSITFKDAHPKGDQSATDVVAASRTHDDAAKSGSPDGARPPRYFRQGDSLIVISPVGDRVTLYNIDTKASESLELSGSKDAPLEVTPIVGENVAALMLKGSKVAQIAVADTASGTWHTQLLREPIEGQVVPIVASGIVVYRIGRDVYAYSVEAQRWDVAHLPEGVPATPTVGAGTATIEGHGHIYSFTAKTGKWDHVDIRAILDSGGAKKKK